MFGHHRIHQEQLHQIAAMMKMLYGKKKATPGAKSTPADDQEPDSRLYGVSDEQKPLRKNRPFQRQAMRFSRPKSLMETIPTGVKCPVCGELFLQSDYHYTEGTGLCIPCWEKGALSCQ